MEIIYRKRGGGKTSELISLASETDAYIVCKDSDECARISSLANEMGLSIRFPLTYREFVNLQYHPAGCKGFLIDNADLLLKYLSPAVEIKAITLTEQTKRSSIEINKNQ